MNFPTSRRTGRRAEMAVDDHFTSWHWSVGQDHIDSGYDLCITPDYEVYRGVPFFVQVKGTLQTGTRALAANVEKQRLRQYARNVIPVFLIRVMADRSLYWLHAQAWTKNNEHLLEGEGKTRVVFDPTQDLADRVSFEAYLARSVRPLIESGDPLSSRPSTRSFSAGSQTVKTVSQSEDSHAPSAKVSFKPVRSPENLDKLRDAYHYGLPRTIEVEDFSIFSDLAPELQLPGGIKDGRLTLSRVESSQGAVKLCPGTEYSVLAQELSIPSTLFEGSVGIGITNQHHHNPLDVTFRMEHEPGRGVKSNFQLGIRTSILEARPLATFTDLAPLAAWAEQVADQDAMLVTLDFKGEQEALSPPMQPLQGLLPVLKKVRSLSRLHMVARALRSDFVLTQGMHLSIEDFQDIDMAFELLRGEKKLVKLDPLDVESVNPALRGKDLNGMFFCTTTWQVLVAGNHLGEIPLEIQLCDYVTEWKDGGHKIRLSVGESGQAWMRYTKHGEPGSMVRRVDAIAP